MYTIQCTLYNVHCIVYIYIYCVQSMVYTVYSVQCTNYIVYSVHCTMYSVQTTVYTVHNVHCTSYMEVLSLPITYTVELLNRTTGKREHSYTLQAYLLHTFYYIYSYYIQWAGYIVPLY